LSLIGVLFLATGYSPVYSDAPSGHTGIAGKVSEGLVALAAKPTENSGDTGIMISNIQNEVLRNSTFAEVRDFILEDKTSQNQFIPYVYECRHFATDVNNNAEAAGIRCAFVLLCYPVGQHAVVAFETIDRGLIYIEPQTDAAIQPEVGGRYQNQEIVEILICW